MWKQFIYQIYLKTIAVLVVLGLVCSNPAWYYYAMSDLQPISFSMYDPVDSESENKTKKSDKEKDEKIRSSLDAWNHLSDTKSGKELALIPFQSLHHPEITTPPPEFLFTFS